MQFMSKTLYLKNHLIILTQAFHKIPQNYTEALVTVICHKKVKGNKMSPMYQVFVKTRLSKDCYKVYHSFGV